MKILSRKEAMEKHQRFRRIHVLIESLVRVLKSQRRRPRRCPESLIHPIAEMADQEEDYSSLPLPDRFTHKVRLSAFVLDFSV